MVIALLLAAVLLFRLPWRELERAGRLGGGRLDLLALAFLTMSGSYFVRALQWRLLLRAEKRIAPLT
jgi:hypothetical protein